MFMLAAVLSSRTSIAQPGWFQQVSGTTRNLNAIASAVYPGRIFAVGDSGTILLTSDQGETWSPVPTNTTLSLNAIGFANPDTGFAVGDSGVILKVTQSSAVGPAARSGVNFHGVAVVPDYTNRTLWPVGDSGTILRSIDRGVTWLVQHPTTQNLRGIAFATFSAIYAVGDSGTVLKSTDAGGGWSPSILPPAYRGLSFYAVSVVAGTVWIAGENGAILMSSDGGTTWLPRSSHVSVHLRSAFFSPQYANGFQNGEAWMVGDSGTVVRTGDGSTWSEQVSGTTKDLRGVLFIDSLRGIAVGAYGTILRTLTAGSNLPWLLFESTYLDFGPVSTGSNKSAIISVRNQGLGLLNISSISSTSSEFSVSPPAGIIAPGSSQDFTVSVHPETTGSKLATISFAHIGLGQTQISTTAQGIDPIVPSGWRWQNPLPQGNSLFGITCLHHDTLIGVGALGTVLKSTDDGVSWSVQHNAGTTKNSLRAVSFASASTGIVVGDYGTVLRTADGGVNWTNQASGTVAHLVGASWPDPNTCVAVGYLISSQYSGFIIRTTDGGVHWGAPQYAPYSLLGVSFTDANVGLAVGGGNSRISGNPYSPVGVVLRTTNGGVEWTSQEVGTNFLYGVAFSDQNTAVAVGLYGTIIRTSDAGRNWSIVSTGGATLSSISFATTIAATSMVGTAVGGVPYGYPVILRTEDRGLSWTAQSAGVSGAALLTSVCMTDGASAAAAGYSFTVGGRGFIINTTDLGVTWRVGFKSVTSRNLLCVSSPDPLTRIVVGDSATILRTTDGGAHWSRQLQGTLFEKLGLSFSAAAFPDATTGLVVGDQGTIIGTSDGGGHWSIQSSGSTNHLSAIASPLRGTAFVVGDMGTILHTTDGGLSWVDQSPGLIFPLDAVSAVDSVTAVAVGQRGTIVRTTDRGRNWATISSGTYWELRGISFVDSHNGTAVGDWGTILRTTDGGASWIGQSGGGSNFLRAISFFRTGAGFIAGIQGTLLATTDAGAHWISQAGGSFNDLFSVSFSDSKSATLVGSNGTILHTDNGGVLAVREDPHERIPHAFALEQNFPNPFNPSTTISFVIARPSYVSLKIYDILGREVAALVNEIRQTGAYKARWDAANFPTGIYFYRLVANPVLPGYSVRFADVKKMILIR